MPTPVAPRALPTADLRPTSCPPSSADEGERMEQFLRDLYRHHGDAVMRYAARLLGGDRHRAEDILQEAAVRAWRCADRFDEDARPIRPWLWTTVKHLVIDHLRAQKRRPAEAGPVEEFDAVVPDSVDNLLLGQVVLGALDTLTVQQREVVYLLHFAQWTVQQASAHLGIPPGTVKSRSYYAMRALRQAMQEAGALPPIRTPSSAPRTAEEVPAGARRVVPPAVAGGQSRG